MQQMSPVISGWGFLIFILKVIDLSSKKDKIRVRFIGMNAEDVTGSMTLVETGRHKILLEAGLYQSNSALADYKVNSRRLPFKPREIDAIFVGHAHADHMLLIPRLVAEGFCGRIIVPKGTKSLFRIMALDSAYIISKDIEVLSRKYKISPRPIYTEDDVWDTLKLIEEYDMNDRAELDEDISFQFVPSGHIICAAQIKLWLRRGTQNVTRTILYTSDLGNVVCEKYYVPEFEKVDSANLVIAESTYSDELRAVTAKDRQKDLEKIESIIRQICLEQKGKVLIPIFSLDRCQNLMTYIYDLFGQCKDFDIPVLIDSPMAIRLSDLYGQLLTGEQKTKWDRVREWPNFRYLMEYEQSQEWMHSDKPCIILAASGFMQAGRSRQWAKALLPKRDAHIIFVGFSTENALAGKIKHGGKQKTITIDGKQYANRCGITDLKSFSGHMQKMDMLKYYAGIRCEKLALVHGDFKAKCVFAKDLQERISKNNGSAKVICVNKSTEVLL